MELTCYPVDREFYFDQPEVLAAFSQWFDSLVSARAPDLVVAMARGAVRFIQMAKPKSLGSVRFVSDHAIPFLADTELSGRNVLLIDDSVIFGSTIKRVYDALRLRGAIVQCATYAVDAHAFFGRSASDSQPQRAPSPYAVSLPITCHREMADEEIRRHHAAIVRNVASNPLDYNLDFGSASIHVVGLSASTSPYFSQLLHNLTGAIAVVDVTSSVSASREISRYSVFLDKASQSGYAAEGLFWSASPKLRLIIAPQYQSVILTPVVSLAIKNTSTLDSIRFHDQRLQSYWTRLRLPECSDVQTFSKAALRILTAMISTEMAAEFSAKIECTISPEFRTLGVTLDPFDFKCVVGEANQLVLSELFSTFDSDLRDRFDAHDTKNPLPVIEDNIELAALVTNQLETYAHLAPHPAEPLHESFGKVFLALREAVDSDQQRLQNPHPDRLERALTGREIGNILASFGIQATAQELSTMLDICVDNGLAVPKFICRDEICCRAFFCGEDEDDQSTQQLKAGLHKCYSEHLQNKPDRFLSPFDMTKLCSILREVMPWVPINNRFGMYGRRSYISTVDINDWLTDAASGAMTREANLLIPRSDYVATVQPTWGTNQEHSFQEGFAILAAVFSKKRFPEDAKVLLSTCITAKHTLNAIAFELDNWASSVKHSMSIAISVIQGKVRFATLPTGTALAPLFWATQFVVEAARKHRIFRTDFRRLSMRCGKAFEKEGPFAYRWWKHFLEPRLDSSIPTALNQPFADYKAVFPLVRYTTAYLHRVLSDMDTQFMDEMTRQFSRRKQELNSKPYDWLRSQSVTEAAKAFNDHACQQPCDIPPLPRKDFATLPAGVDRYLAASSCLEAASASCQAVSNYVRYLVPRYTVADAEFPYIQDGEKRLRDDGALEISKPNHFLLIFDAIGSTNSAVYPAFRERVFQQFERSRKLFGPTLVWEFTNDDCLKVISPSGDQLLSLAQRIAHLGSTMGLAGDSFRGTRKALAYGNLKTVSIRGELTISDSHRPSLIAQAASMLTAVDHYPDPERQNEVVVCSQPHMEALTHQKSLGAHRISAPFPVTSKHFKGMAQFIHIQP